MVAGNGNLTIQRNTKYSRTVYQFSKKKNRIEIIISEKISVYTKIISKNVSTDNIIPFIVNNRGKIEVIVEIS